MNYSQALKLLDGGNLNGIYVLSGDEIFLVDTFVEMFKNKIVSMDFFDMNYIEYDFSKVDLQKLKMDCETAPFFSTKRLVILKNVNLTKTGVSSNKEFFEQMYDYIKNIPLTTVLLLVMKGETAFRGKFYKEISILGHNIELVKLNEMDLFRFIKKRFNLRNITISEKLIYHIMDRIGYLDSSRNKNLYDVENELKKVLEFENINHITADDIDNILIDRFENSIFKLIDVIGAKNYKASIVILKNLFKSGEDGFRIFYMIIRLARNLLGIKYIKTQGKHLDYIAKELRLSNYECKKLYGSCDNFSMDNLCDFISDCYEMECKIKSQTVDINILLEILISKVSLGGK